MEGHGAGAERWGEGIQERALVALPGEKVLQGQHVLCVCMCVLFALLSPCCSKFTPRTIIQLVTAILEAGRLGRKR